MKLKVCGMRESRNIAALLAARPDYIGFIFYEKSKRFATEFLDEEYLKTIKGIEKVGVFVNETEEKIITSAQKYNFKTVQLHGDEAPQFCASLREKGYKVIKAFSIDSDFNFGQLIVYKSVCDYFLFDTKGEGYGGTGKTFDWSILEKYDNEIPLFLSGGIDLEHAETINGLAGLNIHAIDINSRFEIEPGLKDIERIKKFKDQLH